MSAPDRRGFLRGLATLPLIGGGVALIGQPTAAAVPVTDRLLDTYDRWLDLERSFLRWHRYGSDHRQATFMVPFDCVFRDRATGSLWDSVAATSFDFNHDEPRPSTRAAVILSAAGVPIGGGTLPHCPPPAQGIRPAPVGRPAPAVIPTRGEPARRLGQNGLQWQDR